MTSVEPHGRYRQVLLAWLALAGLYIVVPVLALMASSRFYVHLPLLLTYLVLIGAVVAAALYLEDAIRHRAMLRAVGASSALVAAAILVYTTLTYCPS